MSTFFHTSRPKAVNVTPLDSSQRKTSVASSSNQGTRSIKRELTKDIEEFSATSIQFWLNHRTNCMIRPGEWTPDELQAIAARIDYVEAAEQKTPPSPAKP